MAPHTIALPTYHNLTYQVLGTPSEEDLASIANAQAVQFLRTLPIKPKRCVCVGTALPVGHMWSEIFPRAMLAMAMLAMAMLTMAMLTMALLTMALLTRPAPARATRMRRGVSSRH